MPCDGEQECSPHTGQGVTRSRAIAHVRRKPASQPSVRTHRSKAGMAASQHSSTSSSTDSTTERTQQQASAGPAGAQQLFDAWINAWRSLGVPAAGAGAAFQMPAHAGLDGRRPEDFAIRRRAIGQRILHQVPQGPAQPMVRRNIESYFLAPQDLGRQLAFHQVFQNYFLPRTADFET